MKERFDILSARAGRSVTHAYSTSFSMGIYLLSRRLRNPIYSIYGMVRLADEIVDSFDGFDKRYLLHKMKQDTFEAIRLGISLNPVLNAFQHTVHRYRIDEKMILSFFESMEMDLETRVHTQASYARYICGSAEAVGLMCLRVFTSNHPGLYEDLQACARRLGAAFQKINFLRDLREDSQELGRCYFPGVQPDDFTEEMKSRIEEEIEEDLAQALPGIRKLPPSSKRGVYLSFVYYKTLFNKIKKLPPHAICHKRVRINNGRKIGILCHSLLLNQPGRV